MPATQDESTIIFTAIPRGTEGPPTDRRLRLSIFTTFRLTKDPSTVADYVDVVNWPSRDVSFTVTVGSQSYQATVDTTIPRDQASWAQLFPSSTNVIKRDGVEDHGSSRFRSFSAKSLSDALNNVHLELATKHPNGLPPVSTTAKSFGFLAYQNAEQRDLAFQAVDEAIRVAGTTRFTPAQLKTAITSVTTTHVARKMRGRSKKRQAAKVTQISKALTQRLSTDTAKEFMIAEAFRDLRNVSDDPVKKVVDTPEFDFHERLSALNGHPYLLRRFGIVRDVVVNIGDVTSQSRTKVALVDVSVTATWTGKASKTDSFKTKALFAPSGTFRTATRQDVLDIMKDGLKSIGGSQSLPRRLKDGYIKLNDGKWQLVTVNIEEAALAMGGLSAELSSYVEPPVAAPDKLDDLGRIIGGGDVINPVHASRRASTDPGDVQASYTGQRTESPKVAPPSWRSNGIYLVRDGIESELKSDMIHMSNLESFRHLGQTVYLCAEDITRGYAIDVWDSTRQAWRSLCERVGTYVIGTTTINAPNEHVGEAAVTPALAGVNGGLDDFVMHPALVNWTGWSLAAPMPGKLIASTGASAHGQPLVDPSDQTPPNFPLHATYKVRPRTLPKLRFGHQYKLRARAVDIAGNVIPLADARDDAEVTIGPVSYLRYDPIPAPYLLLRTEKKEAESTDRMVIRSNYDADVITAEVPERMVIPPRTGWSLAEWHGAFDDFDGLGRPIVRTDAFQRFADPSYNPATEPHKEGGSISSVVGERDPIVSDPVGDPYTFPYLPEASTRTVRFEGLPGRDEPYSFDMYLEQFWPYGRAFVIKLIEGSGEPELRVEPHTGLARSVLVLKVPKGRAYTVRYSSVPVDPQLSALRGLSDNSSMTVAAKTEFLNAMSVGSIHTYTPSRDLLLVHAVLQPNDVPDYSGGWQRGLGDTFAFLTGTIAIDRPSTGRVYLNAQWTEFHDSAPSGPLLTPANAIVAEVPVGYVNAPPGFDQAAVDLTKPEVASGSPLPRAVRHEFDDTKHREITYTPVASSRFIEYFPRTNSTRTFRPDFVVHSHVDPTSVVVVKESDPNVVYVRGVDWDIDADDDDIWTFHKLAGGAIPISEIVDITYERVRTRTGDPATTHVASSARPAAPKIAFITPAFKWEPDEPAVNESNGTTTSTRHGKMLRVWMDRPWYSSGQGEKLGVLLAPTGTLAAKDATALERYVTRFGADPLFQATTPKSSYARAADLPASTDPDAWGVWVASEKNVTLQELPKGPTPTVLGYNVEFDPATKRWYSDISFDILSTTISGQKDTQYMPFVRLALVRYQDHSLPTCEVSQVVTADFVQLTPDRTATILRTGSNLDVTVQGNSFNDGPGEASKAEVTVQMQVIPNAAADFEWANLGPEINLQWSANALRANFVTWTGSIAIPNAGERRLVIREYENYEGIGQVLNANSEGADQKRLVYMDIIPVF